MPITGYVILAVLGACAIIALVDCILNFPWRKKRD
jgi:hypothetical protein